MSPLELLRTALGNLLLGKPRTALTMLGVIIGVGVVVLLISLGEGLRAYVEEEMTEFGTNLIIVTPGKSETTGDMPVSGLRTQKKFTHEDADHLERTLINIDGIVANLVSTAEIKSGNRSRKCLVFGTGAAFPDMFAYPVDQGRFFRKSEERNNRRVCVLGYTIVDELYGGRSPVGDTIKVGTATYRVIGVMSPKGLTFGFDYDDIVYMPVTTHGRQFGNEQVMEVDIAVREGVDPDTVARNVRRELRAFRGLDEGEEDFTLMTQENMMAILDEIMSALTVFLGGLAAVSLLVGSIGIMNIMLVVVKERTREIGIRKAMGATKTAILLQFLIESATIGLIGGVIGMGGAVGLLRLVGAVVPEFPVVIETYAIALGMGVSLCVGIGAGMLPAWQAANQNIVDALRYE